MAGVSTETVFPDLHHKMSKKIAQLTKVIYHLNTKNDDHEYEIQGLTEAYESEIDQILKDAYTKINEFRRQLEQRKEHSKAAEQLQVFMKRQDEEKMNALKEMDEFKRRTKEQQLGLQKAADKRIADLVKELEDVKTQFGERLQSFADLVRSIDSKSSASMEEVKRAHKKEMSEMVQTSNKKYNEMLEEKLSAEEKLREQFTSDLQKEKERAEKAISQARLAEKDSSKSAMDSLRGEHEDAIKRQEQQWKDRMDAMKSKLEGDLEGMSKREAEAASSCKQLKVDMAKLDRLVEEQKMQMHSMQGELDRTKLQDGERKADLESLIRSRESEVRALTQQVKVLEENLNRSGTEAAGLQERLKVTELDLRQLKAEHDKACDIRDRALKDLAAADHDRRQFKDEISRLEKLLQNRGETLEGAGRELSACRLNLEQVAKEKGSLMKELEVLRHEAEAKQGDLGARFDRLKADFNQRQKDLESAHARGVEEMQRVAKQQLSDADQRHARETVELKSAAAATEQRIREESRKEIKELENLHEQKLKELERRAQEAADAAAKAARDLNHQLDISRKQLAEASSEAGRQQHEHTDQILKFQTSVQALESKLKSSQERVSKLESELHSAHSTHELSKNEHRNAQGVIDHLKKEMDKQRVQHAGDLAAARSSSEDQIKRLNEQWSKQMEGAGKDLQQQLMADLQKLGSSKDMERRQVEAALQAEISSLKAAVQQAKDQELAAARDLQLKLEALRNENSSLLAKLRAEHAEEIKSLRSLLQQSSSEAAEKFQATLLEEKEKLRKEHAEDLARFTAEHQLQLNAQKSEQEARARAIQDEASRKLAEHNADWTKRFDAAIIAENVRIQSLNQQTAKEKDSAHAAELSGMSKQVQALGETVRGKDRELSHAMDIQAELRSHVQQLERQV